MTDVTGRKYTFENYLTDSSNRFAANACMAVAENPFYYINPLLVYGVNGCGKTHLLHAVENRIKEKFSYRSVVYTTAEELISVWISMLKSSDCDDSLEVLCSLYRSTDVLIIDNFEDMAGKSAATDLVMRFILRRASEHFQTVLALEDTLITRRYLMEEFRLRFENGLMADVRMAGTALKKRLVRETARDMGVELDEYIVNYVAGLDKVPPAELKGIVMRVLLYRKVNHAFPTLYWLERNID